jgi:acylphosphatase
MGWWREAVTVLHVAVRGRVQGVGFRWFVRERARALGLSGWVRNNSDGSVEVFAVGPQNELAKLRKMLEEGPPAATVDVVEDEQKEPSARALSPFGVLR